jgi:hypothetical protein
MVAKRRPKRVEIGLRLDDMLILRTASRAWREVMMRSLRDMRAEMARKIAAVEKLDDALVRLDVSIATAEAAYGLATEEVG